VLHYIVQEDQTQWKNVFWSFWITFLPNTTTVSLYFSLMHNAPKTLRVIHKANYSRQHCSHRKTASTHCTDSSHVASAALHLMASKQEKMYWRTAKWCFRPPCRTGWRCPDFPNSDTSANEDNSFRNHFR